ncbi:DUF1194 domain-containing protein [Prosthecomicrobium sp. N25]|uniref:DUF1194 domain-containing protein n=1 Tax=Prosthecomicrobium sp. N25 TaxID=3129254 RepID=UPI003077DBFE
MTQARIGVGRRAAAFVLAAGLFVAGPPARAAGIDPKIGVDTALVLAVDVSSSVDEERFRLQMEGIARALEDPAIQKAILGGARGAVAITLVQWSDRQSVTIPWMRVASRDDAYRLAATVRNAPRRPGDFTCAGAMLHFAAAKLRATLAFEADRFVVDVSGDGRDNCNSAVPPAAERDALVAMDTTVNGLPILEGDEKATLEDWYRRNIQGGPASFVVPADGYRDFGRAIRQKFLTEVSAR